MAVAEHPIAIPRTRAGVTTVLHAWVTTVDHKQLGLMYIWRGWCSSSSPGSRRRRCACSSRCRTTPSCRRRCSTGCSPCTARAMVFLVGMPIIIGLANYLIPLMIGARDLAFPRLNAFGFWLFLFGGLLLYFSFFGGDGLYGAGSMPDVGWFAYAPLTGRAFSRGNSTDYWILGLLVSGFGSHRHRRQPDRHHRSTMRCPGMTFGRLPLFVWLMLVVVFQMLIVAAAAVGGAGHAALRPLPRRALLRHPGRRLGGAVAALLLDLRPPRGLHPDPARLRLRLRDHPGVLAQADLRLPGHGRRRPCRSASSASASGRTTCSPSA